MQLMSHQIGTRYNYAGEDVILEKGEVNAAKFIFKPGITVLGFKDASALKDRYNIKHASFIYPAERYVKGSTVAFSALLQKCVEKNKIVIVRLVSRSNATPKLAALLPQVTYILYILTLA